MKNHISIDEETMGVLRAATVTAKSVKLSSGQLARPLYVKVNKVLELAGGKWNRAQGAHVFTDDPRAALGLAVTQGAILDRKKEAQAFYTPAEVARRLIVHLGDIAGKSVLEPSAGRGALAAPCFLAGALVDCVEQYPRSVTLLCSTAYRSVCEGDFLKQPPKPVYDRVVMNPPFSGGQDIAHVTHAFAFLKTGGRLGAITAPGWKTHQNKKSSAFRLLVAAHGRVEEEIEGGAFQESGTGVRTLVVILDKASLNAEVAETQRTEVGA